MEGYNNLVTEMEGQYLQKVLNPIFRVKLYTLYEKYQFNNQLNINIIVNQTNSPCNIIDYYKKILSELGINNIYQQYCYLSFLLELPIRTQIQFIKKSSEEKNKLDMVDVFLSELYEKNINIDIAKSMPRFTMPIIIDTLIKNKLLDDGYQLQPISTDNTLNSNYFALTILTSEQIRNNKFLIFDYIVRIGYMHNLLNILGYQSDNNFNEQKRTTNIEDMLAYSGINQDRNIRDLMCRVTAYMCAYYNLHSKNPKSFEGAIMLFGLAEKSKGSSEDASKRLDSIFNINNLNQNKDNDITSLQQIAYLPASVSQGNKQATTLTYSVYVLLGAIAEIMKAYLINKKGANELSKIIQEMAQIQYYPQPNRTYRDDTMPKDTTINNNDDDDNDDNDNEESTKLSTDNSSLVKLMITWLESINADWTVSPHVLGKISSRIYYAINNIETSTRPKTLGIAMHRHIIAILNSILVEDVKENTTENININYDNPFRSDSIFINNLNKINKLFESDNTDNSSSLREQLSFSRGMLSCPLLLMYLDTKSNNNILHILEKYSYIKESNDNELLHWFKENSSNKEITNYNFFKTIEALSYQISEGLNKVIIKNETNTKKTTKIKDINTIIDIIKKNIDYALLKESSEKEILKILTDKNIKNFTLENLKKSIRQIKQDEIIW